MWLCTFLLRNYSIILHSGVQDFSAPVYIILSFILINKSAELSLEDFYYTHTYYLGGKTGIIVHLIQFLLYWGMANQMSNQLTLLCPQCHFLTAHQKWL